MRKSTRRDTDAASIASDLMLAPMVAWMRMPLLAQEAASGNPGRSESLKAVTEKMAAVREGIVDAQLVYWRSMSSFWPEVMSGRTPSMMSGVATERAINAALKPSSRRVKSNYKRLTGKS